MRKAVDLAKSRFGGNGAGTRNSGKPPATTVSQIANATHAVSSAEYQKVWALFVPDTPADNLSQRQLATAASYLIRRYLLWPVTRWLLHRPSPLCPLRYAQAIAPGVSGTAVMAGLPFLIRLWIPAVTAVPSMLVVSALAGGADYGAVVCATAPDQCRALWWLPAQRIPAHGAWS
ncbi:MAG TPA: hypothetical protein VFL97_09600 [Nitrococcus sp.]|nr:hypothetical protein [Nitrococcus sp.]